MKLASFAVKSFLTCCLCLVPAGKVWSGLTLTGWTTGSVWIWLKRYTHDGKSSAFLWNTSSVDGKLLWYLAPKQRFHHDDDDDELCVSIETGPPGTDEWGESLPEGYRRHVAGETPQPALGASPSKLFHSTHMYFVSAPVSYTTAIPLSHF